MTSWKLQHMLKVAFGTCMPQLARDLKHTYSHTGTQLNSELLATGLLYPKHIFQTPSLILKSQFK